jgi:hypothetical protein
MLPLPSTTPSLFASRQDDGRIFIEERFVYGRGNVSLYAHFDTTSGALLLEESGAEGSRMFPITSEGGIRRLIHICSEIERVLPPPPVQASPVPVPDEEQEHEEIADFPRYSCRRLCRSPNLLTRLYGTNPDQLGEIEADVRQLLNPRKGKKLPRRLHRTWKISQQKNDKPSG